MNLAWLVKIPGLRRLLWRISRHLYRFARGEVRNDHSTNGETYVQACVIRGAPAGALTVFDVGANLGEWTRLLLGQLPEVRVAETRVLAFEPVPTTFEELDARVAGFDNSKVVTTYPLAFSNVGGKAEMLVVGKTGGTNTMHFDDQLASDAVGRVSVKKVTLDVFCKVHSVDHIHLVKCDAEGHDAHVLMGARGLLKTERIDVVQFEYNQRWINARCYLKDVFELIEGLPYRIARVRPDRIEVFDQWHFELERFFEANYLLVREPALAWFDVNNGSFDQSNTYA